MNSYLVTRVGEELGSFDLPQIQEGLKSGFFLASDWVWSDGMDDWQPLSSLADGPKSPASTQPLSVAAPQSRPAEATAAKTKPAAAVNPYAAPGAAGRPTRAVMSSGAVPASVIAELAGTKPWITLISVLMWIGCALMILVVIGNLMVGAIGVSELAKSGNGGVGGVVLVVVAIIYGFTAMLIIYPTLKLTKYSSNIGRLVQTQSIVDLTAALKEQRRFWKFYGILIVIYLCLIGLTLLVVFASAGLGFMTRP